MVETLAQLFLNTIKTYPKDEFMLYKKEGRFVPISTREFGNLVKHFSLGLRDLGADEGDKLIILSENRPEWVIVDFANLCFGGITVPVYTSLVAEQIKYIIDDSDTKIVVFSNEEQWKKIKAIRPQLQKVKHYISLSSQAPNGVLTYEQVLERGRLR